MSTGSVNLDLLLNQIAEDAVSGRDNSVPLLHKRFPSLTDKEISALHSMFISALSEVHSDSTMLIATAPLSFGIKARSTMNTVKSLLENSSSSILITGYSLSDYFNEMIDCIINKSQKGILVKFFVNQIENQTKFDKLCRYKGRFLKIYNYSPAEDKMAALHAKVISVDQQKTLITSANLSYHGQEANIEVGALVNSQKFAQQVDDLFTKLLFNKVFVEA